MPVPYTGNPIRNPTLPISEVAYRNQTYGRIFSADKVYPYDDIPFSIRVVLTVGWVAHPAIRKRIIMEKLCFMCLFIINRSLSLINFHYHFK